ncbi:hypothetical protein AQUCO_01300228v1 [Aquilegia coerulea]|uniref:beta-carotene 3-hydroxylase n=1 Tax=Aquilegia coerulea TaxID=218851 RepID=A0A2G5E0H5_AQUCA|nr:hypothetical protein AQUCO_01300228v1 [Aquilegia coerulea]
MIASSSSMAPGFSVTLSTRPFHIQRNHCFLDSKPNNLNTPFVVSRPLRISPIKKNVTLTICFVAEKTRNHGFTQFDKIQEEGEEEQVNMKEAEEEKNLGESSIEVEMQNSTSIRVSERLARKKSERFTYLIAAVMSSLGITSMAILAVYYRFSWQMEGGDIPVAEMLGTFFLSVGAAVGMEFWARWAHKALWHASLWHMHESHHKPREGPFELNDVFAITNAVPAIALLNYGFFHKGIFPGLCFGAYLEWPTCLSTMAWSTEDSPSDLSPMSLIYAKLLLLTK